MSLNSHLIIFIYTGDKKLAGTKGTVHVKLYGDNGKASREITLNNSFSGEFERNAIETFRLSLEDVEQLGRFVNVDRVELWKDKTLGFLADDWFLDKIVVENSATNISFIFPVFRWIKPGHHYRIKHLDTSLPQNDEFPEQRKLELENKKKAYQLDQKLPNGPVQIKSLPPDEQFSFDYTWDLMKASINIKAASQISKLLKKKWERVEDIRTIYSGVALEEPKCAAVWDTDINFGRQRIASTNPTLITLLTSVPEKFPITDELLKPLLEDLTIEEAITQKRLFLCDLQIMEGIPTKANAVVCSPFALLFVDKEQKLVPVAIQLFQEAGPENPIFTASDDPMLWKLVKMWYNNADSCYHQAVVHLGLTHLLMEGFTVSAQRNLSVSHPVYKILAPHFLYIIAINSKALDFLVSEGGWGDKTMAIGSKGLTALAIKGIDEWRMNVEGLLSEDLKARGLEDPSVLPGYYYRDDGLLIFDAIKKYVTSYVGLYYTSEEMFKEDLEIQAWAQELVKEKNKSEGGVGKKGVPGNGSIENADDLVNIITSIIFTCSVSHASSNFGQYDEYGFPPNYPSLMIGKPPTSKDCQLTEKDILNSLPSNDVLQDVLVVTKILSCKATNSLGDFEVQFIFDPKAKELVNVFREDLKEITNKITTRNADLSIPYEYLLPERVPNSIGI